MESAINLTHPAPLKISNYLAAEWKPALGCTEPAAVAYAAALAAEQAQGKVLRVKLVCDPRIYKNCFAVGLPNSGHKTGILWALAIGANLKDASLGLRGFEGASPDILGLAQSILEAHRVTVDVLPDQPHLLIDVTVEREGGTGRAVLEHEHTRLVRLEANGQLVGGEASAPSPTVRAGIRATVAAMSIEDMMQWSRTLTDNDRRLLREGSVKNVAIAQYGLSLIPGGFSTPLGQDTQNNLSRLVSAGVYARMSGEPRTVMTLAGSGNKGITVSVPIVLWGLQRSYAQERVEEALAFACLLTSAATHHLGTLSAMCATANAAGIGIAGALVMLEGGSADQVGMAVNHIVGSVAGMVCDGAKVGCAVKTMTGVDAAFRASNLALAGFSIPATDGIVGESGDESLVNLGRLARRGMTGVDAEILRIMQEKLAAKPS